MVEQSVGQMKIVSPVLLNTPVSMLVSPVGSVTEARLVQLAKQDAGRLVTPVFFKLIELNAVLPANADVLRSVSPEGRLTLLRLVHPLNAFSLIVVSELQPDKSIEVMPEFWNACFSILVTPEGTANEVRLLQPLNEPSAI